MRNLSEYVLQNISESQEDGKNGHWEEFYDEDTEEKIKMWVDDPDPDEVKKRQEQVKQQKADFAAKVAKEKEIMTRLDKAEDNENALAKQLNDLKSQKRRMMLDMEDEVGKLYHSGKESDADKKGSEYGAKIDKLQGEYNNVRRSLMRAKKNTSSLRKQLSNIW